jgi:hypothetical protein
VAVRTAIEKLLSPVFAKERKRYKQKKPVPAKHGTGFFMQLKN